MAGLLVIATHIPLGQQVLKRGIVFIDLAVAQIAALGVIAADFMGWEPQGWAVQIAALCAALVGALLLTWTEKTLAGGARSAHRCDFRASRQRRHLATRR